MSLEYDDNIGFLLDQLVRTGVLTGAGDGDGLQPGDEFIEETRDWKRQVTEYNRIEIREELSTIAGDDDEVTALLESSEPCTDILAEYLTLGSIDDLNHLSHSDRLRSLTILSALDTSSPTEGAPEPFIPVNGHRLPFLVQMHSCALVYIWLDDCPSCDIMKETLEEVLSEPPEEVALYAVYGPDCSQLLEERYDVPGGPVTLSFCDGLVDARMYGAQYKEAIRNEIMNLIKSD
jgi:thiol-disulfide isomerase/thioredoxin